MSYFLELDVNCEAPQHAIDHLIRDYNGSVPGDTFDVQRICSYNEVNLLLQYNDNEPIYFNNSTDCVFIYLLLESPSTKSVGHFTALSYIPIARQVSVPDLINFLEDYNPKINEKESAKIVPDEDSRNIFRSIIVSRGCKATMAEFVGDYEEITGLKINKIVSKQALALMMKSFGISSRSVGNITTLNYDPKTQVAKFTKAQKNKEKKKRKFDLSVEFLDDEINDHVGSLSDSSIDSYVGDIEFKPDSSPLKYWNSTPIPIPDLHLTNVRPREWYSELGNVNVPTRLGRRGHLESDSSDDDMLEGCSDEDEDDFSLAAMSISPKASPEIPIEEVARPALSLIDLPSADFGNNVASLVPYLARPINTDKLDFFLHGSYDDVEIPSYFSPELATTWKNPPPKLSKRWMSNNNFVYKVEALKPGDVPRKPPRKLSNCSVESIQLDDYPIRGPKFTYPCDLHMRTVVLKDSNPYYSQFPDKQIVKTRENGEGNMVEETFDHTRQLPPVHNASYALAYQHMDTDTQNKNPIKVPNLEGTGEWAYVDMDMYHELAPKFYGKKRTTATLSLASHLIEIYLKAYDLKLYTPASLMRTKMATAAKLTTVDHDQSNVTGLFNNKKILKQIHINNKFVESGVRTRKKWYHHIPFVRFNEYALPGRKD